MRLPDGPKDNLEFLMAYAAAMASKQSIPGGRKHALGSIADTLSNYQRSSGFLDMADSTRDQRRRHLSKIEQTWGTAKLLDLRDTHIEADLVKLGSHAANHWRKNMARIHGMGKAYPAHNSGSLCRYRNTGSPKKRWPFALVE